MKNMNLTKPNCVAVSQQNPNHLQLADMHFDLYLGRTLLHANITLFDQIINNLSFKIPIDANPIVLRWY